VKRIVGLVGLFGLIGLIAGCVEPQPTAEVYPYEGPIVRPDGEPVPPPAYTNVPEVHVDP
jgi:hypothetical protein